MGFSVKIRVWFITSFIRSEIMYNAATWDPFDSYLKKLEIEWICTLYQIVKRGFKRKNKPPPGVSNENTTNGD